VVDRGRSRAVVVADTSDTWSHRKLAFLDEIDAFQATSVELIETGPVRGIIRVNSEYGSSRLTEDYVVAAGATSVEVRVILDWREHAKLLKLRYAARVEEPAATYEIPYGVIARPANGEEEPGQRWVDVSGVVAAATPDGGRRAGLAVLNDAKYGFDVAGGEIGVTAVRSPIYAHHEPALPREGVRYQFQDQGQLRFTLALVPHLGDWTSADLTRRAAELNQRPTVLFESFHPGSLPPTRSFASVEPGHVIVGAIKLAEDADEVVIRVAETTGRRGNATVRLHAWNRDVGPFEIGPFEIRTFRVPRDQAAPTVETNLLERVVDPG
jgi:alpha-mannosidase